jgi:hypothetical protein
MHYRKLPPFHPPAEAEGEQKTPPFRPPVSGGKPESRPPSCSAAEAGRDLITRSRARPYGTTGSRLTVVVLLSFLVSQVMAQDVPIVAAEYFFDDDPGAGNGNSLAVSSGQLVSIEIPVSASGLSPGFHTLGLRYEDSSSAWSAVRVRPFFVSPMEDSARQVVAGDFWLDDSLIGTLPVTPGPQVSVTHTVSTETLPTALHTLAVRFQDEFGVWSAKRDRMFYAAPAGPPDQEIVGGAYWLDEIGGFPFDITPGPTVSVASAQSTDSLDPGFHQVRVEFYDNSSTWSAAKTRPFYLSPVEQYSDVVTAAEYAIDGGPMTPIPVNPAPEVDISQEVSSQGLEPGFHNVAVHFSDANSVWGPARERPFLTIPHPTGVGNLTEAQAVLHGVLGNGSVLDTTFALHAADGALDSTDEETLDSILTSNVLTDGTLPRGDYTLSVRYRDDLGTWTAPVSRNFIVTSGLVIFPHYPGESDVSLIWFQSQLDVGYYSIYASDSCSGVFTFLDSTNVGSYVHVNILAQSPQKYYFATAGFAGQSILVVGDHAVPLDGPLENRRANR